MGADRMILDLQRLYAELLDGAPAHVTLQRPAVGAAPRTRADVP
jgi:hypothetical protein